MEENGKQTPESLGIANEIPKAVKYKRSLITKIIAVIFLIIVISIAITLMGGNNHQQSKQLPDSEVSFEYIAPKIYEKRKNSNEESKRTIDIKKDDIGNNGNDFTENNNQKEVNLATNSNIQPTSLHNTSLLKEYFEQQALLKIKEDENARLSGTGFSVSGDLSSVKQELSTALQNTTNLKQDLNSKLLKSGSIIPCVLVTAINSDLSGMVVARVRENVFDTATGNHLLIPQGAVLTGEYGSEVNFGQKRALVKFNNIHFSASSNNPEGYTVSLKQLQGADLDGHSGLADRVDNHFDKVAVGISLSSLLAAMAKDPVNGKGYRSRALNKTAENISSVGSKIADKQLSQKPTITVRSGAPFNIMVAQDLSFLPITEDN